MAHSVTPHTYRNGFRQLSSSPHWTIPENEKEGQPHYEVPPSVEFITSPRHNDKGINVLRTWPTLYDGTASPHGLPEWWKPASKVDVLICGAGPSGLEVALSLLRQGLTFRIIDKSSSPLIAGRADGVQPRFLETLGSWGLTSEVAEEGPLIERTAIYYDGQLLHHGRSHQSDSRYRGLHIITQGQIERIYVRDLLRHKMLVERNTTLQTFEVDSDLANDPSTYPVQCAIENSVTKEVENIQAKFLVGSDGASSSIRRSLDIPFDGVSTDIYWGIMDCVFETDYPHAWIFGSVISSEHGGCVIIPRENGYIRLYTQLNVSQTGPLSTSRQAKDPEFSKSGGQVDIHSITPEEVLEQANRVFAPYKLSFGAPLSWFAVWKISERVARSFSSSDLRVHLVGDAAHVHSVMGAFGLNASILDAANLAWKLGLCAIGKAQIDKLLPTYDRERRYHAAKIIEISGKYLRFVCRSQLQTTNLYRLGADLGIDGIENNPGSTVSGHISNGRANGALSSCKGEQGKQVSTNGTSGKAKGSSFESRTQAKEFLRDFFSNYGAFLLGVDSPYGTSGLSSSPLTGTPKVGSSFPITVKDGVRAPNPRVCMDTSNTGYLYDVLKATNRFHLVVFGSDLQGPVRQQLALFSQALVVQDSFYEAFGGPDRFNLVLVAKGTPFEIEGKLDLELAALRDKATVLADDRAPDEDAHSTWGVDHCSGAVVVIRPDLWVGISAVPADVDSLAQYFGGFLEARSVGTE